MVETHRCTLLPRFQDHVERTPISVRKNCRMRMDAAHSHSHLFLYLVLLSCESLHTFLYLFVITRLPICCKRPLFSQIKLLLYERVVLWYAFWPYYLAVKPVCLMHACLLMLVHAYQFLPHCTFLSSASWRNCMHGHHSLSLNCIKCNTDPSMHQKMI